MNWCAFQEHLFPRPHSPWRDFKFVLNQVTRTIAPALPLARLINEWHDLSRSLAEPPRRRLSQLSEYFVE